MQSEEGATRRLTRSSTWRARWSGVRWPVSGCQAVVARAGAGRAGPRGHVRRAGAAGGGPRGVCGRRLRRRADQSGGNPRGGRREGGAQHQPLSAPTLSRGLPRRHGLCPHVGPFEDRADGALLSGRRKRKRCRRVFTSPAPIRAVARLPPPAAAPPASPARPQAAPSARRHPVRDQPEQPNPTHAGWVTGDLERKRVRRPDAYGVSDRAQRSNVRRGTALRASAWAWSGHQVPAGGSTMPYSGSIAPPVPRVQLPSDSPGVLIHR